MAPPLPESLQKLVDQWLQWDPNPVTRDEISRLVSDNNVAELQARLATRIAFGTAGLRGPMQAGNSSMNVLTVIQASQGLCKYILESFGDSGKERGVVIGYDGRHNSREFARRSAITFISQGIRVYLFSVLVPTPFVPFAVLQKGAVAGVMVTASHNPKNDNGYKVYWDNGCQIVTPHDTGIAGHIDHNLEPWKVDGITIEGSELLHDPTQEIERSYYSLITEKLSHFKDVNPTSNLKTVYTPMHGVGHYWAVKAFEAFNLPPFIPVEQQKVPDPEFPTVEFPNPEEGKGALKLAIETAEANGVRLILANDPDADRLAVAEKLPSGEWKIFNGNEIGSLLAAWVWEQHRKQHPEDDPSKCLMISTAVSSQMLRAMAAKEGFRFEETLTGFKWIGSVGARLQQSEGYKFLFGYEEAIGFMVGDICFDKDGIRGIAIFAEMASQLQAAGLSCYDRLTQLYQKYGHYVTCNKYFFCYDPEVMRAIFRRIRTLEKGQYPSRCGEFPIHNIRDLTTGHDTTQPDGKAILPISSSTEMISFYFENGCLLTLRGSGTEPKLKYYAELHGNYEDHEQTVALLQRIIQSVIQEFLRPEENHLEPPRP